MQAMNMKFSKYSPHFHEERSGKAGNKRKPSEPLAGSETVKLRVCQPNLCKPTLPAGPPHSQCILFIINTSKNRLSIGFLGRYIVVDRTTLSRLLSDYLYCGPIVC